MASGLATNTEIEMRFYPTSGYGLLMYASQAGTLTGDFIALGLEQSRPIFRINLGTFIKMIHKSYLPSGKSHLFFCIN